MNFNIQIYIFLLYELLLYDIDLLQASWNINSNFIMRLYCWCRLCRTECWSLSIFMMSLISDLFLGLAWPESWLVSRSQRQKWQESQECWLACWCLLSFILCKYSHNYHGGIREKNVTKMSGEAESSPGRNIPTPEQCFYASFKIYLSDSRTNSICELEDSGW